MIHPKAIEKLEAAILTKNVDELKTLLHPQNRELRKKFEVSQNTNLPKTVKGTNKALDEWAGNSYQEVDSVTEMPLSEKTIVVISKPILHHLLGI